MSRELAETFNVTRSTAEASEQSALYQNYVLKEIARWLSVRMGLNSTRKGNVLFVPRQRIRSASTVTPLVDFVTAATLQIKHHHVTPTRPPENASSAGNCQENAHVIIFISA